VQHRKTGRPMSESVSSAGTRQSCSRSRKGTAQSERDYFNNCVANNRLKMGDYVPKQAK
jgi:hypothetical protein